MGIGTSHNDKTYQFYPQRFIQPLTSLGHKHAVGDQYLFYRYFNRLRLENFYPVLQEFQLPLDQEGAQTIQIVLMSVSILT